MPINKIIKVIEKAMTDKRFNQHLDEAGYTYISSLLYDNEILNDMTLEEFDEIIVPYFVEHHSLSLKYSVVDSHVQIKVSRVKP